ncbi:MAG: hypothetical protein Kilf2KO_15370 [Rhodospirillales bacterium]
MTESKMTDYLTRLERDADARQALIAALAGTQGDEAVAVIVAAARAQGYSLSQDDVAAALTRQEDPADSDDGVVTQADTPDTMLSLLYALRATQT